MKPTQRDWSECSNPSNQSSKLQNQIFEILSANPLQTNQSKPIEKSKGKISFDPTQGNLFVISLKKVRGRGEKKKKNGKDCPRKLRRARARARSAPTRLSIRPCGGETMTILLHSDAGLLAGETMAPADMQPAKTDMSVQRTRRLAWDFVFSSLRQATHPGRGSNFWRAGCTFDSPASRGKSTCQMSLARIPKDLMDR